MGGARRGGGTSARPLDESIAGIAPGIPDDALGPGESLPNPPSAAEVHRAALALDIDQPDEPEGHPS